MDVDLHGLLKKDFGVDLPISGGPGNSIDAPILIHYRVPNDYVAVEYEVLGCLGAGRGIEWEVIQQSSMKHNDRRIDQVKIETRWTTNTKVITQTENYYFDITEFFGADKRCATDTAGSVKANKSSFVETLFDERSELVRFVVSLKKTGKATNDGSCIATLEKERPDKWCYMLEVADGKYISEHLRPFAPNPENFEIFNQGCRELARRFRIYLATQDANQVPQTPRPFGDLTYAGDARARTYNGPLAWLRKRIRSLATRTGLRRSHR